MDDVKVYMFKHFDIEFCYECPFEYDYIYCKLDENVKHLTTSEDMHRPVNCPLKELI